MWFQTSKGKLFGRKKICNLSQCWWFGKLGTAESQALWNMRVKEQLLRLWWTVFQAMTIHIKNICVFMWQTQAVCQKCCWLLNIFMVVYVHIWYYSSCSLCTTVLRLTDKLLFFHFTQKLYVRAEGSNATSLLFLTLWGLTNLLSVCMYLRNTF